MKSSDDLLVDALLDARYGESIDDDQWWENQWSDQLRKKLTILASLRPDAPDRNLRDLMRSAALIQFGAEACIANLPRNRGDRALNFLEDRIQPMTENLELRHHLAEAQGALNQMDGILVGLQAVGTVDEETLRDYFQELDRSEDSTATALSAASNQRRRAARTARWTRLVLSAVRTLILLTLTVLVSLVVDAVVPREVPTWVNILVSLVAFVVVDAELVGRRIEPAIESWRESRIVLASRRSAAGVIDAAIWLAILKAPTL